MHNRWIVLLTLLLAALACNIPRPQPAAGPSTEVPALPSTAPAAAATAGGAQTAPAAPTATATLVHLLRPGNPGRADSTVGDVVSGDTARQGTPNQPPGGDWYEHNLYERPFNAQTQDRYFPELDIRGAELNRDEPWIYVSLRLYDVSLEDGGLPAAYRVELDLDLDGRGDWLIEAASPEGTEWTVEGVRVLRDTDNDVGGTYPCRDDAPQPTDEDSYDEVIFDQGQGDDPDAAWVRVSPGNPAMVQIAFKHALIAMDGEFMWGVWADRGVDQPTWYDYHDHFTKEQAGSPLPSLAAYYPSKAISEVDNTCRGWFGFIPTSELPCACLGAPTPTPTAAARPARLQGAVFKDVSPANCSLESAEFIRWANVQVILKAGTCPGGATVATTTTDAGGAYSFSGLEPGTYCVSINPASGGIPGSWNTCGPFTASLSPGASHTVNFGVSPVNLP